jgi:hypothetical protein
VGVGEETRQVLQDFLAPELREMRGELVLVGKRLDLIEGASRVRHEGVVQRLEFIKQSFAFGKRLSAIEADKQQSA